MIRRNLALLALIVTTAQFAFADVRFFFTVGSGSDNEPGLTADSAANAFADTVGTCDISDGLYVLNNISPTPSIPFLRSDTFLYLWARFENETNGTKMRGINICVKAGNHIDEGDPGNQDDPDACPELARAFYLLDDLDCSGTYRWEFESQTQDPVVLVAIVGEGVSNLAATQLDRLYLGGDDRVVLLGAVKFDLTAIPDGTPIFIGLESEGVNFDDGDSPMVHLGVGDESFDGSVQIDIPTRYSCTPTAIIYNGSADDTDGDGIPDDVDNCPQAPNTCQDDVDNDGIGDLCEIRILNQPVDVNGCEGGPAELSVVVQATPPITYQWRKDQQDISGATDATLSFDSLNLSDAGSYDVLISTQYADTVQSDPAALTVASFDPPQITGQPESTTTCEEQAFTLSVTASGGVPLSYQWRHDGDNISGANSADYSVASATFADAGSYDVIVSNVCGTAQSASATVVVNAPPTIDIQPVAREIGVQDGVELWVRVLGGPYTYQWRKDNVAIDGATQDTLTISAALPGDAGSYDVVITGSCGDILSDAAVLTVLDQPRAERISIGTRGEQPDRNCDSPSLSADARFATFVSDTTRLVPGQDNNLLHVYLRDRWRAETTRITQSPGDGQPNGPSTYAVVATVANWKAVESEASNLATGDTNGVRDVFLVNPYNGSVQRISVASDGTQADGPSAQPSTSSYGYFTALQSDATNLAPNDENSATDIFVYDRVQHALLCASVNSGGTTGNGASRWPSITDDGRYVTFSSEASDLVADDTNGVADIFVRDLQSGTTTRITHGTSGAEANGASNKPQFSPGGQYIVFHSAASNLVTGDTNGVEDVFVANVNSGEIVRMSFGKNGVEPNGRCYDASISANGRLVAFASDATNLAVGDNNTAADIFLRDRDSDSDGIYDDAKSTLVCITQRGPHTANAASRAPFVAPGSFIVGDDGNEEMYVVFESDATDIVQDDTNRTTDIFQYAVKAHESRRVTVTVDGVEANGPSHRPTIGDTDILYSTAATNLVPKDTNDQLDILRSDATRQGNGFNTDALLTGWLADGYSTNAQISRDGRYVVYESYADNIVGENTAYDDVFVYDRVAQTTTRISSDPSGLPGNDGSSEPSISGDGRFVAFFSMASNLVPDDNNGKPDLFLFDRSSGEMARLILGLNGGDPDYAAHHPVVSPDGTLVAFETVADNIVPGDTNGKHDVFVYDIATGAIERISVASDGKQGNGDSTEPSFSDDGRLITFTSFASNFSKSDKNGGSDVFVRDLQSGTTLPLNLSSDGKYGNDASIDSSLSADGRYAAFQSGATNLVPADNNHVGDIFVRDILNDSTRRVNLDDFGNESNGDSAVSCISADGRFVAFMTSASNLVDGDTNQKRDIYLVDTRACRAPSVLVSPQPISTCLDQVVTFTVSANGTPPLSYQWRKDGADLTGETADHLTIRGTQSSDDGSYSVIVANDCGDVTSASATLTVNDCTTYIEIISVSDGGAPRSGINPAYSSDGHFLAFDSESYDILGDDVNSFKDIFVVDRESGALVRVSNNLSGRPGNNGSQYASISADGRFVAFRSAATDLIAGDKNNAPDVFVRDRDPDGNGVFDEGNELTLIASVKSDGAQAAGDNGSGGTSISADGRFVVFVSNSKDFAGGNGYIQVYLHDMQTGETVRVTNGPDGTPGDSDSYAAAVSGDGNFVVFRSNATNFSDIDSIYEDVFVWDRATGFIELVSVDSSGVAGNSDSNNPAISYDGRIVAFRSTATNLVASDTNNVADTFVHDRETGQTVRASVNSSGTQGNGACYGTPSLSADGQLVAFFSEASNLVSGDTNGARDVFVRDVLLGTTTRISVASDGTQANQWSDGGVSLTADGGFAAFASYATNLVPGAAGNPGVYVRDLGNALTTTGSVCGAGVAGDKTSRNARISGDGSVVVFESLAINLIASDTNDTWDVFERDVTEARTRRVDMKQDGSETDYHYQTGGDVISADGYYVAFYTESALISADTNGRADVYVRDQSTGALALVSISSSGGLGDNSSGGFGRTIAISSDGRFVAFVSNAKNLVSDDKNSVSDVFVHDRDPDGNGVFDESGTTTVRASIRTDGKEANNYSVDPSISADGRFIAFMSNASNLVDNDTNNKTDIFVRDMLNQTTELVSVDSSGLQGNNNSSEPFISSNGRYVVYTSLATNLVANDTNKSSDVFMFDRDTRITTRVDVASDGSQANAGGSTARMTRSGHYVVFQSGSTNLVSNDTNGQGDIFLKNLDNGVLYRVSVRTDGGQADRSSSNADISDDGSTVAFESDAHNLVDFPIVAATQIYRYDIAGSFGLKLDVPITGDSNCDGTVDFNDIDAFVVALVSQSDYAQAYPHCDFVRNNDVNRDGGVNFNDIDGFVECLINGGCP